MDDEETKKAMKEAHCEYVRRHPEVKTMISAFMTTLLLEKPTDVSAFAKEFFSCYKPSKFPPLVIAGPSGVGKGTLINRLMKQYPQLFGFSVSHTTRLPREGEEYGKSYYFIEKQKFEEDIHIGLFLEYAQVYGNWYGTSKTAVENVQKQHKICILDIDVQGVQQVKERQALQCNYLFISPPSLDDLEARLRGRGTETEESMKTRLGNARDEMSYGEKPGVFDAILVNGDLENSYKELVDLLQKWYPQSDFVSVNP
uniref:guanylate kinase n=1 Tax=Albugo laibachii Nc14 TaxID=890382 RepID=F0W530_9STRA|nr:guanylate kinase putative [Albugo laibachii Nc14]|eukprot:CCA16221.1 guanylate kinase putative [Albugo laibachii Nc14]